MDDYKISKENRRKNQEAKKQRMVKSGLGFMKVIKQVYEKYVSKAP